MCTFEAKHCCRIKYEIECHLLVCKWKGFEILEGDICSDHIHLVSVILPKHSVSYAMSIIKGKSSAWIKKKNKK